MSMKTPDVTRRYRDPSAHEMYETSADYWRRNPGPEQVPTPTESAKRHIGDDPPAVDSWPGNMYEDD